MNRYWLLTWTTYGTWLPGDDRGFVSNVREGPGPEVKHNTPGTAYDTKQRGLAIAAQQQMTGPPIRLTAALAGPLAEQFRETARFRGWSLLAVAIMANHVHLVVAVPGDPDPEVLLRDFKSYGSRCLNRLAGKPQSGTWWTASGSRRKLPDNAAVRSAVVYVGNQDFPLYVSTTDAEGDESGDSGAPGEPGASAPGVSQEGEPGASAPGFSQEGEPGASAPGFSQEGEPGASAPGVSQEGEPGASAPGVSQEGEPGASAPGFSSGSASESGG